MDIYLNLAPTGSHDLIIYNNLFRQCQPFRMCDGWNPNGAPGSAEVERPEGGYRVQGPAWSIIRDGAEVAAPYLAGTYTNFGDSPLDVNVRRANGEPSLSGRLLPGQSIDIPEDVLTIECFVGMAGGEPVAYPRLIRENAPGILQPEVVKAICRDFDGVRIMEPLRVKDVAGMRELEPFDGTYTRSGPPYAVVGHMIEEIGLPAEVTLDLDTCRQENRMREAVETVLQGAGHLNRPRVDFAVGNEVWLAAVMPESLRFQRLAAELEGLDPDDESARFHAGTRLHVELTNRLHAITDGIPLCDAIYEGEQGQAIWDHEIDAPRLHLNGYLHSDVGPGQPHLTEWIGRVSAFLSPEYPERLTKGIGIYEGGPHPISQDNVIGRRIVSWSDPTVSPLSLQLSIDHLDAARDLGIERFNYYCLEREPHAGKTHQTCFGLRMGLLAQEPDLDSRLEAIREFRTRRDEQEPEDSELSEVTPIEDDEPQESEAPETEEEQEDDTFVLTFLHHGGSRTWTWEDPHTIPRVGETVMDEEDHEARYIVAEVLHQNPWRTEILLARI